MKSATLRVIKQTLTVSAKQDSEFHNGRMQSNTDEEIDVSIIQRYRLLSQLGKGAYGIVWKAQDKQTGRSVALKKVIGAFNNDVDAQRTYREVFLLQSLCHDRLVKLLNVHKASNDYDLYLVFEYIQTDLYQAIYEGVLKHEHKVYIAYQLFSALAYLETAGVVHRDLKPANILLNSDSEIKIADFGLARTVTAASSENHPVMTEYVATKLYRAPEVMLGSTDYSFPVDIWSIGCILAEMFTPQPRMLLYSTNIVEQLERYFSIFGKPSDEDLQSIVISPSLEILKHVTPKDKLPLTNILKSDRRKQQDNDLVDLITKCLMYNPAKRITAIQALSHPFFTGSSLSQLLRRIPAVLAANTLQPVLKEEVRLSSMQYKKELYRLILEKKAEQMAKLKPQQVFL